MLSNFFIMLGSVPYFLFDCYHGFPSEYDDIRKNKAFNIFWLLKIFRLFHLNSFYEAIERIRGILAEIFYLKKEVVN